MSKIISGHNPNGIRAKLLLTVRIAVLAAPLISAAAVIFYQKQELMFLIGWLILTAVCVIIYIAASNRYKILSSGLRGEKKVLGILKDIPEAVIFSNFPVKYKGLRSEIDFLYVSQKGIIIIEVKNHSGIISGYGGSEKWRHTYYKRGGKSVKAEMDNPLKQMERQKDILTGLLSEYGETVKIGSVLCFSSENAELRIKANESDNICNAEGLLKFLGRPKGTRKLSEERFKNIVKIIKKLRRRVRK